MSLRGMFASRSGRNGRGGRSRTSQVDMIPLIDIVFQLILFFLVSTTFALLPGITVNLPQSATAEESQVAGLVITLSADGGLWLNDQSVTLQQLDQQLAAFDTQTILRQEYPVQPEADAQVTNGVIVGIFDLLRKHGFSTVNLRTMER